MCSLREFENLSEGGLGVRGGERAQAGVLAPSLSNLGGRKVIRLLLLPGSLPVKWVIAGNVREENVTESVWCCAGCSVHLRPPA